LQLSLEHDVERARALALVEEQLARCEPPLAPGPGEPRQLRVAEARQDRDVSQALDGHRAAGVRTPPRYWCTSCTAIDPSPTADATRLMDWSRTSPATNTPGRLVSSGKGSRSIRHRC